MKAVQLWIVLLAAALFIGGCTNAGPFVTNIAFDGDGNMVVTKQVVVYDAFMGQVYTEGEQTIIIKTPFVRQ